MSEEYEIEVIPVVVAEEPIELYKILKIENLVTSGSEAKNYIADGYVYVNGEVETRKRKKIMFGDIIGFDGEAYQVMSAEELAEYGFEAASDEVQYVDNVDYSAEEDDFIDPALAPAPVMPDAVEVIAQPIVENIVETPVVDMWEQPAKQHKKAGSKAKNNTKKSKSAEPKSSNKKKGRAAPFSF